MISTIKKVSTTIRKLRVKNFLEICEFAHNLNVQKNSIKAGYGKQTLPVKLPGSQIKKLFRLGENMFLQTEDGAFCKIINGEISFIKLVESEIKNVCEILSASGPDTLVLCDKPFTLKGENVETLPVSSQVALHKGRLYLAEKNTVYVGEQFDFNHNLNPLERFYTLGVNSKAGKIVGFFSKEENIFVICEKAIYIIKPSSDIENFKFERLAITGLNVKTGSLVCFGGECYFITNKKLAIFDGNAVKRIDTLLDGISATFYDCARDDENYFLPLKTNNGSGFIYRYNVIDGSQEFILSQGLCVCNDGYIVDENALIKLSKDFATQNEKNFITSEICFDDCDQKTLCGIDVNVLGDCTLAVHGGFGVQKYYLKKGRHALCVNLKSDVFKLEFFTNSSNFGIDFLTLFYRLKGE